MDLGASREGAMASDEVSLVTERVRHVSIILSFLERMLAISRNGGVGGAKEGEVVFRATPALDTPLIAH